jgi:5'-nucleotidase
MTPSHVSLGSQLRNGRQPELTADLLAHLLANEPIPEERQIFVNRTLRLESIRHVGFDLDWTLADYQRLPLERLTFDLALDRLVSHNGYPDVALRAKFRPNFPRRGLMIDKEAGTVLRMNRHRYVNPAFFGRQRLGRRELKRLYRYEPNQPSSRRFYHLDSLFELPEANLYSELIDLANRDDGHSLPAPWQLFDDVRAAIDWVHRQGSLKSQVMADIESYLQRDPEVAYALLRLALGGRRLILLTNSGWEYANAICSFLFDGLLPGLVSWRELFDLVLVESQKPEFFRSETAFIELDTDGTEIGACAEPSWGRIYGHGSLQGLMKLINAPGEQVLYVGDHIYGDIVSSKLESTWRTALIVSELEEEITRRRQLADEIQRDRDLKQRLSDLGHEMDHLRDLMMLNQHRHEQRPDAENQGYAPLRERYETVIAEHREVLRDQAHSADHTARQFNPYWGSFFKQGTSKTRFASQLETYACLYTSRVSNFAFYGSNHYFRVTRDPMMHEILGQHLP